MKTLLSIDPGMSTGIARLRYSDDTVPELVRCWQIPEGVWGLHQWYETISSDTLHANNHYILEKFDARGSANGGFAYTTASLEAIRIEGYLYDKFDFEYVRPPEQYIAGGKGKSDKKKRQHRLLKDLGFYKTGKDFGTPDADDFRSATAHALGWLMRHGHKPTYEMVSKWVEENPV